MTPKNFKDEDYREIYLKLKENILKNDKLFIFKKADLGKSPAPS